LKKKDDLIVKTLFRHLLDLEKEKNLINAAILRFAFLIVYKGMKCNQIIEETLRQIVEKDPFEFILTFCSFSMEHSHFKHYNWIFYFFRPTVYFVDMKGELTRKNGTEMSNNGIIYALSCRYFPQDYLHMSWNELLFYVLLFIDPGKCNSFWIDALFRISPTKQEKDVEKVVVDILCSILLRPPGFMTVEEMSFLSGVLGSYSFVSPCLDGSSQGIYSQDGSPKKNFFSNHKNPRLLQRIKNLKDATRKYGRAKQVSQDFFAFSFFRAIDAVQISKTQDVENEININSPFSKFLKNQLCWWKNLIKNNKLLLKVED